MSSFLPRKYNNPVVIGLALCVVLALIVIVVITMRQRNTKQSDLTKENVKHENSNANRIQENSSNETYVPTGKPALVLYYGDWCGHSRAMLPTWEKVKKDLENTGVIEVISFDDKNDKEEVERGSKLPEFRGFPDIRFFPNGYPNGESIPYKGDRSEESLLKFAYTSGNKT